MLSLLPGLLVAGPRLVGLLVAGRLAGLLLGVLVRHRAGEGLLPGISLSLIGHALGLPAHGDPHAFAQLQTASRLASTRSAIQALSGVLVTGLDGAGSRLLR